MSVIFFLKFLYLVWVRLNPSNFLHWMIYSPFDLGWTFFGLSVTKILTQMLWKSTKTLPENNKHCWYILSLLKVLLSCIFSGLTGYGKDLFWRKLSLQSLITCKICRGITFILKDELTFVFSIETSDFTLIHNFRDNFISFKPTWIC